MKDNKNLSEIQKIIWDIMLELKKYLDANNIPYYMLGGTLLGAIRHEGFIPWDDDMDIGIPRREYEFLLKNISAHLPEHLVLETYENNKNHHYYFARICDTRYSLKRTGSLETRDEDAWIDIFPLDGMPNNLILRKLHQIRLLIRRMLYHISCFEKVNLKRPNRPLSERIVIKIIQITKFGKNLNTNKQLNKLDKLLKKYDLYNTNFVINFMGQYKFKEMFPKKVYGEGQMYQFEDLELMGPENYDYVLKQMYGDYMTPPKDSEKNAHAAYLNEEKR